MGSIHTTARRGRGARLASVVAGAAAVALLATGCSSPSDAGASGSAAPAGDASITFIPKQLNNPYTDVVLGGGKAGAKEAGFGAVEIVGPLNASASSQVTLINAETQAGTDVIVIAANDPDAVGPALETRSARPSRRPAQAVPRSLPSTPTRTPPTAMCSSTRSCPKTSPRSSWR